MRLCTDCIEQEVQHNEYVSDEDWYSLEPNREQAQCDACEQCVYVWGEWRYYDEVTKVPEPESMPLWQIEIHSDWSFPIVHHYSATEDVIVTIAKDHIFNTGGYQGQTVSKVVYYKYGQHDPQGEEHQVTLHNVWRTIYERPYGIRRVR